VIRSAGAGKSALVMKINLSSAIHTRWQSATAGRCIRENKTYFIAHIAGKYHFFFRLL
jgi:hypothetical protein